MLAIWWSLCARKGSDNPSKPSAELGQDLADVMAAGAEDGKDATRNPVKSETAVAGPEWT